MNQPVVILQVGTDRRMKLTAVQASVPTENRNVVLSMS